MISCFLVHAVLFQWTASFTLITYGILVGTGPDLWLTSMVQVACGQSTVRILVDISDTYQMFSQAHMVANPSFPICVYRFPVSVFLRKMQLVWNGPICSCAIRLLLTHSCWHLHWQLSFGHICKRLESRDARWVTSSFTQSNASYCALPQPHIESDLSRSDICLTRVARFMMNLPTTH